MSSLPVFNRVYWLKLHPPPIPLPKVKVQHDIQTMFGKVEGGGFLVVSEIIFCRSLPLCFWPDSEPSKLLFRPKQKLRRGGGLRQINTCREVSLQVIFLDDDIWHCFLRCWLLHSAGGELFGSGQRPLGEGDCLEWHRLLPRKGRQILVNFFKFIQNRFCFPKNDLLEVIPKGTVSRDFRRQGFQPN